MVVTQIMLRALKLLQYTLHVPSMDSYHKKLLFDKFHLLWYHPQSTPPRSILISLPPTFRLHSWFRNEYLTIWSTCRWSRRGRQQSAREVIQFCRGNKSIMHKKNKTTQIIIGHWIIKTGGNSHSHHRYQSCSYSHCIYTVCWCLWWWWQQQTKTKTNNNGSKGKD